MQGGIFCAMKYNSDAFFANSSAQTFRSEFWTQGTLQLRSCSNWMKSMFKINNSKGVDLPSPWCGLVDNHQTQPFHRQALQCMDRIACSSTIWANILWLQHSSHLYKSRPCVNILNMICLPCKFESGILNFRCKHSPSMLNWYCQRFKICIILELHGHHLHSLTSTNCNICCWLFIMKYVRLAPVVIPRYLLVVGFLEKPF